MMGDFVDKSVLLPLNLKQKLFPVVCVRVWCLVKYALL